MQTHAAAPTHRYFFDRTHAGGGIVELPNPRWDSSVMAEFRFTYDVLEHALPQVPATGLHFHFTKNAYALPEYGPHVIAVLLQEERCKVPVYGRHVRATIRNLTSEPFIGFRPHLHMGRLEAVLAFEYARDWYTHLKSVRASRHPAGMGGPVQDSALVIRLPLGYHSQEELPQIHMQDRSLDFFFAGEIRHEVARNDYRYWLSTSKFLARGQLWQEVQRIAAQNRWNADLGNIASTQSQSHAPAFGSYSEKMMRTRICVAPRGSVAESYRAYEGLRAGCLVVSNRLPNDEFLTGAPILQVDHWRELEGILERYARNVELLEKAREASLTFWRKHIAAEVLGKQLAQRLTQAGQTLHSA